MVYATRIIIHQPHEHPPTTTQVYSRKSQEVKKMFSNHSCGWGPIIPAQVMIRFWLLETWLKVVDVKIYAHLDYCLWLAATIWYNLLKVKDLVSIPLPLCNGFQELFFRGMISFCLHYTFVRRRNMVTLIAELGAAQHSGSYKHWRVGPATWEEKLS